MNGPTHLAGGLAAGLIVSTVLHSSNLVTVGGVAIACVGGLFPDWLSISVPYLRLPLEGHRGLTHTLIFALLTSLLINPALAPFWFAGLFSHQLLDLPSAVGVPILFPFKRLALGWFPNGGRAEHVLRLALFALCLLVILSWF